MRTHTALRQLVVNALDAATPTLRDVAVHAGLTYHAVRRYRLGDRTPEVQVLQRLARALRDQARQLDRAAAQLFRVANTPEAR